MARFDPDPRRPLALLGLCPAYRPTPINRLTRSSARPVLVKDESGRMGLGAFKALGGGWAVAEILRARRQLATGIDTAPALMTSAAMKAFAAGIRFTCASAGNHGMAVAAAARLFGAKATILLADTVPERFAERLRDKGAEVLRAGETYEESIAAAIRLSAEGEAIHLADGSWPGYTEAPALVMEGYTVIAEEMRSRFESDGAWPDLVVLPGGVGGAAAALAVMIRRNWAVQPAILVAEPDAAPCLAESARIGGVATVAGPVSEMGRLDCKTASLLAVEALRRCNVGYIAISDTAAAAAAGRLSAAGMATTPSGAAALAGLIAAEAAGATPQRPLVMMGEGAA